MDTALKDDFKQLVINAGKDERHGTAMKNTSSVYIQI